MVISTWSYGALLCAEFRRAGAFRAVGPGFFGGRRRRVAQFGRRESSCAFGAVVSAAEVASGDLSHCVAVLAPAAPRNPCIAARLADLAPLAPVRGPVARTALNRAGSTNVSASNTGWPVCASMSRDSRRSDRPRTRDARFGTRTLGSTTNRVLFATNRTRRNCCSRVQPIRRSRTPTLNATQQCQPGPVRQLRHLTDTATDQTTEPKIVVTGHQHVPVSALGSVRHWPHRHLRQIEPATTHRHHHHRR